MSLLTEKQIDEICNTFLINRDTNIVAIKAAVEKWNEEQIPSTQFEPDWDKTSSNATRVYLDAVWFNSEMKEIDRTTICCWDRPITPHPHAEIMMKYAEVAARRVDPWVEFERFSHCDMEWDGLPYHPDWTQGQTYRHIGEAK